MSALIRYREPVSSLSNIFDDFFADSVWSKPTREVNRTNWPLVDIVENKGNYTIHAELPGLDKKDVKVTVEDGVLTISGEKSAEKREEKKDRYSYFERSYGSFERKFQLPDNVNQDQISANFKNGLLTMEIQKQEKALPKAIDIKLE